MKKDLPNLLIVGAAKSGTTSLHNYLNQHSDIFMCSQKEPHYLINNEIGSNRIKVGITCFDKYKRLFSKGRSLKYRGESSVMYLMFPDIVIPKIKELLGDDTKIIIMLRNPIERAFSGFHHNKRYDFDEDLTFDSAWDKCEERYISNLSISPATRYKELGLYYKQVCAFQSSFKNIHVIIYDDYKKDVKESIKKVFEFLNLENTEIDTTSKYMVGGWEWKYSRLKYILIKKNKFRSFLKKIIFIKSFRKLIRLVVHKRLTNSTPVLSNKMKEELVNFYKDDINKTSVLLDKDLSNWLI